MFAHLFEHVLIVVGLHQEWSKLCSKVIFFTHTFCYYIIYYYHFKMCQKEKY